jgi:protein-S-isoprenylcysteine O-methyltransferase Ste14
MCVPTCWRSPWLDSARRDALVIHFRGDLVRPATGVSISGLPTGGLTRWVRNPMYLAVELVIVGQALLLQQWLLLGYAALVGAAVAVFVYFYEEPTLAERHGDRYTAYQATVPRWIPRRPAARLRP